MGWRTGGLARDRTTAATRPEAVGSAATAATASPSDGGLGRRRTSDRDEAAVAQRGEVRVDAPGGAGGSGDDGVQPAGTDFGLRLAAVQHVGRAVPGGASGSGRRGGQAAARLRPGSAG